MENTLTKVENNNGSFTYTATNEKGEVIGTRTSKRGNYIACSVSGNFFFSRLDLIGKGDSKHYFSKYPEKLQEIAYLK